MSDTSAEDNLSPTDAELALFLAGGCAPVMARRVEAWIARDPANRRRAEEVGALLHDDGSGAVEDVDALWTRVRVRTIHAERMAVVSNLKPKVVRAPKRGGGLPAWKPRRVAVAAALLVIGSGLTIMRVRSAATATQRPAPTSTASHDYSTGRGQHVIVQLTDGSRITLAPQTRVRILPAFGVASREIEIVGEAVFDVVHDASRPFRVHAGTATAEDIGTRFDVRRYAGETSVRVAVAHGAVSLGARADGTAAGSRAEGAVVNAGRVARLDDGGRVTTVKNARIGDYFEWMDGALAFNDVPMEDVARTLDRWFDAHVRIGDEGLRRRRVTARFNGQSERAIVDALAATLGAEVEWRDSVVTMRSRP